MKRNYQTWAIVGAIIWTGLTGGCATTAPSTPAQTVFAAKSAYAAVLTAAVSYESLQRCAPAVPKPCSDPALVAQIRRADDVAKLALDTAEAAVRTPAVGADARSKAIDTASRALAALSALLTGLQP
jgi:hypothetical protein